jgi:hypothetical protein
VGPRTSLDAVERNNLLPLLGIELQFPEHPVAVPIELFRLFFQEYSRSSILDTR